jgi:alpha-galactosidase
MDEPEYSSFTRRKLIRDATLISIGGFIGPDLLVGLAHGEELSTPSPGPQTRVLSNGYIQRTVTFGPKGGLYTERLSDLKTHVDYISPGTLRKDMALEFSFMCSGHDYEGISPAFDLVGAEETAIPHGKSLTIHLRNKDIPLEVSVSYSVYDGHPAIRKQLLLHNAGSTSIQISHLNIEALGISLGPENQMTLKTQYGTIPREIFYTGRSEDAGLFLVNSTSRAGLAIISEVPGYMKRTEIGGWDDPDRVRIGVLYDTDLMPFERTLAAGEEFRTAAVSLIAFREGDGFRDPHWVVPSYTSNVLVRRVNAHGPPWIYNTWEPFERNINHDTVIELIDAAGAMGIDIFTIDDGWQDEYGENTVNLASFPGGLKPIQDAIDAKGMRLGLWVPLAAIGTSTEIYRNHSGWAALDQRGEQKVTSTAAGAKVVMCLASPFRDAAADRINQAIEMFHLAYVKLDLTTIFNAYGEAPGCWAKGHNHGSWAESLNMIYEGISHITGKVYEKHPDVLLDLTFELWGQKHLIDAGLLAAGDLDWMSNVDDTRPDSAGPLQARQLLYQRAASMPVESMLIGNIHAELPTVQESFATAIGSAPLLLGDLRKLSADDRRWYHEKIAWFKELRRKTRIGESFFPLGNWRQPAQGEWDGFARLAQSGSGVIALFRNNSTEGTAVVKLPLIPAEKFKVHSVITNKHIGVFTKADWVRGVPITFPTSGPVDVLEVTSIA